VLVTIELLEDMKKRMIRPEIALYEDHLLRDIYDRAGLTSKKFPSNDRVRKAVLGYIGKECKKPNARLTRSWEKSLAGVDTFIHLAEKE